MSLIRNWWKEGVIYQIYPQSFKDTNGDGIGDLRGIIDSIPYIKSLGVDIIWLNPIYASPLDDNGYDISDYRTINPMYGTMQDFEDLLTALHNNGLKLLMDLVVNHTSDEHRWFEESRKSKDNPYRDYYFWRPGVNGGPPNNWQAIFGGSCWDHDPATDEYYLHYFSRKQPDLNWENPKVRQEVVDIVRFWLDKGIDGFRLDVISMISKHLDFPNADVDNFGDMFEKYFCNGPRVHEFIQQIYQEALKDYDVMTVGEGPGISKELGNLYTGKDRGELSMIFPLDLMFVDWGPKGKYDFGQASIKDIKQFFREWDEAVGNDGWMSIFLDNHDFARMVSRFGNDAEFREKSAKCLLTMLCTLRGTPSIHYGSEIGMTNVHFDSVDEYRDIESLNFYREAVEGGMAPGEALGRIHVAGRDNVRTPMQWNSGTQAGFSDATPWLRVNPNHTTVNVEAGESNPDSILRYFRQLLKFRRENPVFVYGTFEDTDPDHEKLFTYIRKDQDTEVLVVLNLSDDTVPYLPSSHQNGVLLGNYPNQSDSVMHPWEARVYSLGS